MPLVAMASAMLRIVTSSIAQPKLFQLFQPIGGVRARLLVRAWLVGAAISPNATSTTRTAPGIGRGCCSLVPVIAASAKKQPGHPPAVLSIALALALPPTLCASATTDAYSPAARPGRFRTAVAAGS